MAPAAVFQPRVSRDEGIRAVGRIRRAVDEAEALPDLSARGNGSADFFFLVFFF